MPVHGLQSLGEHQYHADVICSIPAGGAGERMAAYGCNYGRGTTRKFSNVVGKTLLITDLTATSVALKTVTFKSADFNNVHTPTLAEIVTAINAVLALDATPTVASAGPKGELVITAAAASATGGLTIGAGTANVLFGFPKSGTIFSVVNGTGVTITFPSGLSDEYLYAHAPFVDVATYTPATAVRVGNNAQIATTYTPSVRTLLVANSGGAARVGHIRVAF